MELQRDLKLSFSLLITFALLARHSFFHIYYTSRGTKLQLSTISFFFLIWCFISLLRPYSAIHSYEFVTYFPDCFPLIFLPSVCRVRFSIIPFSHYVSRYFLLSHYDCKYQFLDSLKHSRWLLSQIKSPLNNLVEIKENITRKSIAISTDEFSDCYEKW